MHPPSTTDDSVATWNGSSSQASLRHPPASAYGCFLPDLTGFAGRCRVGPDLQRSVPRAAPDLPGLGRGFSPAEADRGYRAPLAPRLARPRAVYVGGPTTGRPSRMLSTGGNHPAATNRRSRVGYGRAHGPTTPPEATMPTDRTRLVLITAAAVVLVAVAGGAIALSSDPDTPVGSGPIDDRPLEGGGGPDPRRTSPGHGRRVRAPIRLRHRRDDGRTVTIDFVSGGGTVHRPRPRGRAVRARRGDHHAVRGRDRQPATSPASRSASSSE